MSNSTPAKTKRDEILEVASKLFYEQGYNQAGVQQIIKEADTAKGTFYTHFKSKEELGVAWLRARHVTWNGWLKAAIATKETPRDKLLAAFDFLGNWMADCNYRGCAFVNTLCETPQCDSPLRQEIAEHKRELLELFRSLCRQHFTEQPPITADQTGTVIYLLFEGALLEMQNFCEPWPLDTAKQHLESLL
ncbi:TetR/AcrR family transcriptional regulator [Cerasicoccus maritimus]|uniref:TetR/AcrR family transcriptional regulator n=1 Tax=Cerasicoccus maritimus TaxID=490089 RepID=UPI0028526EF7|nr:TetR/AcrR family transcriptional regulator [Cerasicoccus maritimus]